MLSLMLLPTLGRTAVLTPPVFQSYNILLCVSQVETVQMSGVLEVMMQEVGPDVPSDPFRLRDRVVLVAMLGAVR